MNKTVNAVVSSIAGSGDDLDSDAAGKSFYLPLLIPQNTITSQYPLFPIAEGPSSLASTTRIISALVNICTTNSAVAVLLAHPGFAPMFNAMATPQRQISHRILQWVNLKQIIDLSRIQTEITTPIFLATTPSQSQRSTAQSGSGAALSELSNFHSLQNLSQLTDLGSSLTTLNPLNKSSLDGSYQGFNLDHCPPQANYSPSVSPRFNSRSGQDHFQDDDFVPILSLASLLSIPSAIKAKLGGIDLKPNVSMNPFDFFKAKSTGSNTTTTTTTTTTKDSSATTTVSTPTAATTADKSKSTTTHLTKLQQYSSLTLLDAILPFFSKPQVQYSPSRQHPYPYHTRPQSYLPHHHYSGCCITSHHLMSITSFWN